MAIGDPLPYLPYDPTKDENYCTPGPDVDEAPGQFTATETQDIPASEIQTND